ncbi:hypothetical protein C8T65DRAFT_740922 [Cerioporus squamosus]|nr:hypothetical protein C8T65DRAFT_740922 [Cerioporus squamosus]
MPYLGLFPTITSCFSPLVVSAIVVAVSRVVLEYRGIKGAVYHQAPLVVSANAAGAAVSRIVLEYRGVGHRCVYRLLSLA